MPSSTIFEYGPEHVVATIVASVGVYLWYSLTVSRIFTKAGIPAWQAWSPFLNVWRLLELGGQAGWWVIVAFIPFVGSITGTVFLWIAQFHIGRAMGKSDAFVLVAILASPVWFGILAFGSSAWDPRHDPRPPARLGLALVRSRRPGGSEADAASADVTCP